MSDVPAPRPGSAADGAEAAPDHVSGLAGRDSKRVADPTTNDSTPMPDQQARLLEQLCDAAGASFDPATTKVEASQRIEQLRDQGAMDGLKARDRPKSI